MLAWMDVCMYGCIGVWMDGWMDGSMYACMQVCMYACTRMCGQNDAPPKKKDKKRKNDGRTKGNISFERNGQFTNYRKTRKKNNVKTYPFKRVAMKLRKQVLIANDGMQVNGLA